MLYCPFKRFSCFSFWSRSNTGIINIWKIDNKYSGDACMKKILQDNWGHQGNAWVFLMFNRIWFIVTVKIGSLWLIHYQLINILRQTDPHKKLIEWNIFGKNKSEYISRKRYHNDAKGRITQIHFTRSNLFIYLINLLF